jgi:hypothetical protein
LRWHRWSLPALVQGGLQALVQGATALQRRTVEEERLSVASQRAWEQRRTDGAGRWLRTTASLGEEPQVGQRRVHIEQKWISYQLLMAEVEYDGELGAVPRASQRGVHGEDSNRR